jgi:hypothetical protein
LTVYHTIGDGDAQVESTYTHLLGKTKFQGGKKYMFCYIAATATSGNIFQIANASTGTMSPQVVALADGAFRTHVAVPPRTYASGDYGWVQIGGPASVSGLTSATYTAGDALKIHDGAVVDNSTNIKTDNSFATVDATQVTTQTTVCVMNILGYPCLATT